MIAAHLGDGWLLVECVELLEMRLIVFARQSLQADISNIATAVEATGLTLTLTLIAIAVEAIGGGRVWQLFHMACILTYRMEQVFR